MIKNEKNSQVCNQECTFCVIFAHLFKLQIMLIQFTVGNFLSFRDKRTVSFKAGSITELPENVAIVRQQRILKSAVVYGANSSGKSNLIKAMARMRKVVLTSVKLNDKDQLDFSPFLLSNYIDQTTHFEVEFEFFGANYRYGFEYNSNIISEEWLFKKTTSKSETPLFFRTEKGIRVYSDFAEGYGKEESTNENRLFLSLVAQLGGDLSKKLINWFRQFNILSGIDNSEYAGYSLYMLNEKLSGCQESLELFQKLKLGFSEVSVQEAEFNLNKIPNTLSDNLKTTLLKEHQGKTLIALKTIHNKYDNKGKVMGTELFDADDQESEGTKKIIDLSGPIFDTLKHGKILVIDELDAKLHPLITIQLIKLFNDPKSNPKNAQLFFATHDTHLLAADLFRRDQVWFTEKDGFEQTDVYSLLEFKLPDGTKVRNDSNLEKNYIRGRYGAIPFMTS